MKKLTHVNSKGMARQVDVGSKINQLRIAKAYGIIKLSAETIKLIQQNNIQKGDVLNVAQIAGIQAAKKTAELIPLCHQINLTSISVIASIKKEGVGVLSEIKCIGQTGVEMEALTAVSTALLTIYDMCKSVDKNMHLENIHLLEKTKNAI